MPPIIATGYSFFLHPKLNDPWQEYVDTVHSNNRYMYNLLQKTCKHRVTHVPSNTKMVNVDILSNDTDPFDGVVAVIEALPQQTIGIRASWGFRHTVMTVVDRKIRTSIGADVTKKQIEELAKAYCVHII
jgi:7-keto-8-aminopelargonate synthetase-like enzyme